MRQDLLDKVVWIEVVRLLEDPQLIQIELDRRLQAARRADPAKRREEALRRDLLRIHKSIERLLTAYQEDLISLDELRQRMPDLRMREQTSEAELQAIADQSAERAACLRLAETVADFLSRLRSSAGTLNVPERQRVVRLLVKEIFVGDDKIVIRHSIPLPANPPGGPYTNGDSPGPGQDQSGSYLLRSGRDGRSLPRSPLRNLDLSVFENARPKPFLDQAENALVADAMFEEPSEPFFAHRVEELRNVGVDNVIHLPGVNGRRQGVERVVRSPPRPESVTEAQEVFLVDRVQHVGHGAQRPLAAVRFRYVNPPARRRPIRPAVDSVMQVRELTLEVCFVVPPRYSVDPGGRVLGYRIERGPQSFRCDVMQERGELACDASARPCVRDVLCGIAFPSVPALGSPCSAAGMPVLFAGFTATSAESDFSRPFIAGYGSSPSRRDPATQAPRMGERSPGSRTKSFRTCEGLRPRRAVGTLALSRSAMSPSVGIKTSAPGII